MILKKKNELEKMQKDIDGLKADGDCIWPSSPFEKLEKILEELRKNTTYFKIEELE